MVSCTQTHPTVAVDSGSADVRIKSSWKALPQSCRHTIVTVTQTSYILFTAALNHSKCTAQKTLAYLPSAHLLPSLAAVREELQNRPGHSDVAA